MSIKFGAFVPQGWLNDLDEIDDPVAQYEAMTGVAKAAEAAGFDSLWVYDHFHNYPTPKIETTFEAWTITAGMARDTRRIRLGQMVTCNGYRNPAYLAKVASTIDVMSQGRLICGLGAGWYEHEWRAYGYGFPELGDRMRAFAEAVEVVIRMWTDERASFKGRYYTLDGAINEPKGVQQPHIPLWLGGEGEKVTLRLVAQWADGANFGGGNLEKVRQKMGVLRQHCQDLGRDFDTLERSTSLDVFLFRPGEDPEKATAPFRGSASHEEFVRGHLAGTPDQVAAHIEKLVEAGVSYVIAYFPRVAYDHSQLEYFAEQIIPRFS